MLRFFGIMEVPQHSSEQNSQNLQGYLSSVPVTYMLTTVGGVAKSLETDLYFIKLVDRKGGIHRIQAYGIDQISTEIISFDINDVMYLFPGLHASQIKRKGGSIDLLIGMEYAGIHPWKIKVVDNLALYQTHFGTGKILGGYTPDHCDDQASTISNISLVAKCKVENVRIRSSRSSLPDFFSCEQLGIEIPP